jgi:thiol:disulfide interchange protein
MVESNSGRDIITSFETRSVFMDVLKKNPGLLIVKFGADWCVPCSKIKDYVHKKFAEMPDNVLCADIDVEESFDLFAFLKQKKMVKGIPAMLAYVSGNHSYPPDESISGTDEKELDDFFNRCLQRLK